MQHGFFSVRGADGSICYIPDACRELEQIQHIARYVYPCKRMVNVPSLGLTGWITVVGSEWMSILTKPTTNGRVLTPLGRGTRYLWPSDPDVELVVLDEAYEGWRNWLFPLSEIVRLIDYSESLGGYTWN